MEEGKEESKRGRIKDAGKEEYSSKEGKRVEGERTAGGAEEEEVQNSVAVFYKEKIRCRKKNEESMEEIKEVLKEIRKEMRGWREE